MKTPGGGGLEFASGGPSQLGSPEVDGDHAVLAYDGEAFSADNYGRGLAYTNAEEGIGEGILILSKKSDGNGRNK